MARQHEDWEIKTHAQNCTQCLDAIQGFIRVGGYRCSEKLDGRKPDEELLDILDTLHDWEVFNDC